jgi:tight adherence protein B
VLGGLALGHRAGTLDARTVERLAGATERRLVLAADARAQAATARLSALLLVLAPLGVAALAASGDGGHAAFLLTHPAGRACAVAGVGLDLIGWWWMRRIIAGVVR